MTIYETWFSRGYDKDGRSLKKVWDLYLPLEQRVYEEMLKTRNPRVNATLAELAAKYDMSPDFVVGFLDGIKEALVDEGALADLKDITEETAVDITVDFEKLYRKMVEYKADHLYNLPEWDGVFDEERRKELYTEQKNSGTVKREEPKVGRNDPCPCGSGKKYKHCCGKAA